MRSNAQANDCRPDKAKAYRQLRQVREESGKTKGESGSIGDWFFYHDSSSEGEMIPMQADVVGV